MLKLQDSPRTWLAYIGLLCILGWVFLGRVTDLPLDVDDDSYLLDSRAVSVDFAHSWPERYYMRVRDGACCPSWPHWAH